MSPSFPLLRISCKTHDLSSTSPHHLDRVCLTCFASAVLPLCLSSSFLRSKLDSYPQALPPASYGVLPEPFAERTACSKTFLRSPLSSSCMSGALLPRLAVLVSPSCLVWLLPLSRALVPRLLVNTTCALAACPHTTPAYPSTCFSSTPSCPPFLPPSSFLKNSPIPRRVLSHALLCAIVPALLLFWSSSLLPRTSIPQSSRTSCLIWAILHSATPRQPGRHPRIPPFSSELYHSYSYHYLFHCPFRQRWAPFEYARPQLFLHISKRL